MDEGRDCKVVFGSCASGFKDVTGPLTYRECVSYLKAHIEQVAHSDEDAHYTDSLDIMNVQSGRLMSYVIG
jgi:hypothetical protein